MLTYMLFDGLVRYAPGNTTGSFEPGIAKAIPQPKQSDGGQSWTVELRDGVICPASPSSPEYELTASDVVYSLNRAADPKRSAFASQYANVSAVEEVDEKTVRIALKEPRSEALFLPLIANYGSSLIVCSKAVEALGDKEFGNFPVGTGAYAFESYTPGREG